MMISCGCELAVGLALVLGAVWLVITYLRQQPTSGGIVPYAPIVIRDLERGDRGDDD